MKDSLGDRIKQRYEFITNFKLARRTYSIIRLDMKCGHSYTRTCERPYDAKLRNAMSYAAEKLCKEAQGAVFSYTQSDEISILLQDFTNDQTDAWFDGRIQKITSVSASIVTAAFNEYRKTDLGATVGNAYFDSRVFTIPDRVEVMNYFIWRQKDAARNSLSMLAQHHFSHKQLMGKSQSDMHEMLHEKNINWNDEEPRNRRGTLIRKDEVGWAYAAPEIWHTEGELADLVPNYPHVS